MSPLPRIEGRQFLAYLSLVNDVVSANLKMGSGPYVRPDGMQVASDWADLFADGLTVPIALDERGASVPVGELAWTGTTSAGTLSGDYCAGWMDATAPQPRGMVGDVNDAVFWTNKMRSPHGAGAPRAPRPLHRPLTSAPVVTRGDVRHRSIAPSSFRTRSSSRACAAPYRSRSRARPRAS